MVHSLTVDVWQQIHYVLVRHLKCLLYTDRWGSRVRKSHRVKASLVQMTYLIFLVSGLWHSIIGRGDIFYGYIRVCRWLRWDVTSIRWLTKLHCIRLRDVATPLSWFFSLLIHRICWLYLYVRIILEHLMAKQTTMSRTVLATITLLSVTCLAKRGHSTRRDRLHELRGGKRKLMDSGGWSDGGGEVGGPTVKSPTNRPTPKPTYDQGIIWFLNVPYCQWNMCYITWIVLSTGFLGDDDWEGDIGGGGGGVPCEELVFFFYDNICSNQFFIADAPAYESVVSCCNYNFGMGSFDQGQCGYRDLCTDGFAPAPTTPKPTTKKFITLDPTNKPSPAPSAKPSNKPTLNPWVNISYMCSMYVYLMQGFVISDKLFHFT